MLPDVAGACYAELRLRARSALLSRAAAAAAAPGAPTASGLVEGISTVGKVGAAHVAQGT